MIWHEVLYAFRNRFFVPAAVQTNNFTFLEPPLLVDGLGDSRGESCPAGASAERSDRKGVSGALGRYAFPDEAYVVLRWMVKNPPWTEPRTATDGDEQSPAHHGVPQPR